MDTNLLEKLPKTQKQWLLFFKKVESIAIEVNEKYANASIKKWLKKAKDGEVSYYRKKELLSAEPKDKLSYKAIYKTENIKIEDDFRGEDEGDFRDRGHYYNVSFDNVVLKYRITFLDFIEIKETIDGIDCLISVEKNMGAPFIIDFWVDVESMMYRGTYNGQTYTVHKVKKNATQWTMPMPSDYLLKCFKKELAVSEPMKWALEFCNKTVTDQAAENIIRFIKQGYRPIEAVEEDEE